MNWDIDHICNMSILLSKVGEKLLPLDEDNATVEDLTKVRNLLQLVEDAANDLNYELEKEQDRIIERARGVYLEVAGPACDSCGGASYHRRYCTKETAE